ncbi:hypothetical protein C7H52_11155, partial [Aurantibacter aestuarii]
QGDRRPDRLVSVPVEARRPRGEALPAQQREHPRGVAPQDRPRLGSLRRLAPRCAPEVRPTGRPGRCRLVLDAAHGPGMAAGRCTGSRGPQAHPLRAWELPVAGTRAV